MKKTEIYVPIANKKEAKRAKAVLKALGEVIDNGYEFSDSTANHGGLYFNYTFNEWCLALSFNNNYPFKKITLKQLIEFLVKEQPWQSEKIAVRVDNEKEFNALMRYINKYDFNWDGIKRNYPNKEVFIYINNSLGFDTEISVVERNGYNIIPFSDFAAQHNIKLPLILSEDKVWLYEGDKCFMVYPLEDYKDKVYEFSLLPKHNCIIEPHRAKVFSTKQSALKWIEAQKPETITVELFTLEINAICYHDKVIIKCLSDDFTVVISKEKLAEINKSMEELNG